MLESDQMTTSMYSSMSSWFTPTYLFCFLNLMIATIYIASNFKTHHHHQDQDHHPPQPGQLARSPSLLNRVKSINFPFYNNSDHHYTSHFEQEQQQQPTISTTSQLTRAPSLLERVKSINFSFYGQENHYPYVPQPQYEEPTKEINTYSSSREEHHTSRPSQLTRAPSLLERVRSYYGQENHYPLVPTPQYEEPTKEINSYSSSHEEHHNSRPPSQLTRTPSLLERVRSFNFSSDKPAVISEKVPAKKPAAKMKKSASAKRVTPKKTVDEDVERRRPATARERKSKKETAESTGGEGGGCVNEKADDFINKFKQQLKLQRLDSMLRYKEMLGRGT